MNKEYKDYCDLMRKISDVNYSAAVLGWDQEVYMPSAGAKDRAGQLATLSGISHELFTDKNVGTLLKKLHGDSSLSFKEKRNVEETEKSYTDLSKYSTEFVMKMSRAVSEAYQAWDKAKKEKNFEVFAPALEKLVELKREECELLSYKDHPYDALLDQYERGSTVKELSILFEEVKLHLVPFVKRISETKQNDASFLNLFYPKDKQWEFGIDLLKQMKYDFSAGRQDVSSHPFTTSFGPRDVRVTTRINENDLSEMIWSCIHEGGHALYEQGLDAEEYGLPSSEAVSLGIHESQSRLWENHVGRGESYWKLNYKKLQAIFPENLASVSEEQFYKAINQVKPSLVRTSADELTYHFHVIIRFEIEKALIEGSIQVKDLPRIWNEKYLNYLGVKVGSADKGVLQDIHWSHGSFGYFPTYSVGSFYAAQFYAKAQKDIPSLNEKIESGNFMPLLEWLRKNIHVHGKLYLPEELCVRVTGEKLNFKYFMEYARAKYTHLYQLKPL